MSAAPAVILRGLDMPVRDRFEAAAAIARDALLDLRLALALPCRAEARAEARADRAIAIAARALVAIDTLIPPPAPE